MRYCTVSIRTARLRVALRLHQAERQPRQRGPARESSAGAPVPSVPGTWGWAGSSLKRGLSPECSLNQEPAGGSLKPQPTSLPELRNSPWKCPRLPASHGADPAGPPGAERPRPPRTVSGLQAPRSLLTSPSYHCSVQALTNSRAMGMSGEGTQSQLQTQKHPAPTHPTHPPKCPKIPQRDSFAALSLSTRPHRGLPHRAPQASSGTSH